MQPSKPYAITLLNAKSDDQMAVFYYDSRGILHKYSTVQATLQGSTGSFQLQSSLASAAFFVSQLLPSDGSAALSRIDKVRLISFVGSSTSALKIKLIFEGGLRGLSTASAKSRFADALFSEMTSILGSLGVSVEFDQEIVDPNGPAKVVPFGGNFVSLDGTRVPGYVHFFLVDSIAPPPSAQALGGYILGFAPREAIDLSLMPESRIILSNRYLSIAGLATTATHELGHFFGLRHTTATEIDMGFDKDFSNIDDGLLSTGQCIGLAKRGIVDGGIDLGQIPGPGGLSYCLRMAFTTCPSQCDLSNLMFAYDCSSSHNTQRKLTQDQIDLWRKNLALLQ